MDEDSSDEQVAGSGTAAKPRKVQFIAPSLDEQLAREQEAAVVVTD
jgi:hypothetical protein